MQFEANAADASADNECLNAFKIETDCTFQKDRNNVCAPETGLWFFHHPAYEAFQAAKGPQLLFTTAEAGGGKSTVSRTIIDQSLASDSRPLVAYYFFKDDDDQLRSYEDALGSMIHQLFVQQRSLIKCARLLYKQYGYGIRYQTKEMWNILFAIATEANRDVVCILDAVDECAPAGRRQLIEDLVAAFQIVSHPTARLKLVATSRPYRDDNHPYDKLTTSNNIRQLIGENAKVQSDIQAVICYKAEELAKKRQLSSSTLEMLVQSISSQNTQTRSFLAVRMAFELLDSHSIMHDGAGEDVIRKILDDVPQSLSDQFDTMLNRSADKEHARRLFSIILASRKTLKLPEFKILYSLTDPTNSKLGKSRSYPNLDIVADDEEFKRLVRSKCGLFITFVRSSVHLFHQTAREHLMCRVDSNPSDLLDEISPPASGMDTWKGFISNTDANLVFLVVCLDIMASEVPETWVQEVFDSLNSGNGFFDDIRDFVKSRPLFEYAALNWHEHYILGGQDATVVLCDHRYTDVLDVSKASFWSWWLTLANYICTNTSKPEQIIASIWETEYETRRLKADYGQLLRDGTLTKLFGIDQKIHDLLEDPSLPLSEAIVSIDGPVWRADNGYGLIDQFHLSFGEYDYSSCNRAVKALENQQLERARVLFPDLSTPTMIWTCISESAPTALRIALSSVESPGWLGQIPEHLTYRRRLWQGWCSLRGIDFRETRNNGWTKPFPPAFVAISRALNFDSNSETFAALADWMEASLDPREYARLIWEAGGFVAPSLSHRLVAAGADVNLELWKDRRTALQIASHMWEHDAVGALISLGGDSEYSGSSRYPALYWFLDGPESPLGTDDDSPSSWLRSKKQFSERNQYERQRYQKSKIVSTLKALLKRRSPDDIPINPTDTNGKTALMVAVINSPTATKALLDEGAEVDRRDLKGRTAMMHFFRDNFNGRPMSILKHLLGAGGDSLASDASGHTVLQYWLRTVKSKRLSDLYAGTNSYNKAIEALMSTGALSNRETLVRELVRIKMPLAAAIRLANARLCWAILETGVSPDKHGLTADCQLVENDGSVATDLEDLSWRPLLIALSSKAYTTTAILLAYGADVTFQLPSRKRTKYNKYRIQTSRASPLHFAASPTVKVQCISLATGGLSEGCAFRAVGNLDYSIKKKSGWEMLARQQRKAYKRHDQRRRAEESSDSEYEIKFPVFSNDSTGAMLLPFDKASEDMVTWQTFCDPLIQVIIDSKQTSEMRRRAIVEYMLSKGAPVNARLHNGTTPLACVEGKMPEVARTLIKYGADPNIATDDGCTPLMRAAHGKNRDLVELLLKSGANPNAQINVGSPDNCECASFINWSHHTFHNCDAPITALVVATERQYVEIVKLLLKHGADPNLPIVHHAHGRLPSKRDQRRSKRYHSEPDSSDSDEEPEYWRGYISIATALTWARGEVRELLLQHGADPAVEEPIRECDCTIIEKKVRKSIFGGSDDEYPTQDDDDGSDAELLREAKKIRMERIKSRNNRSEKSKRKPESRGFDTWSSDSEGESERGRVIQV